MDVISTKYVKKGKDKILGKQGALIQSILPDEEYYPITGTITIQASLQNFEGLENMNPNEVNPSILKGEGKLTNCKFSLLGETDFNKQDIIKILMTEIDREQFYYNWRRYSDYFEVSLGITKAQFSELKSKLFMQENVITYLNLELDAPDHIFKSVDNDIAILRYPEDLENWNELPKNFKVFNENNLKEIRGDRFYFSYFYKQKIIEKKITKKNDIKKSKSFFSKIFGN